MSVNANYAARGGTFCDADVGLGKHATIHNHLLTAAAGPLIYDGKLLGTAAATADITPTALPQQAVDTTCIYVCHHDGTAFAQVKGAEMPNHLVDVNNATLGVPAIPADTVAIAYYKVKTVGVTFVNGTTDYNATGVTTAFTDVRKIPSRVQ